MEVEKGSDSGGEAAGRERRGPARLCSCRWLQERRKRWEAGTEGRAVEGEDELILIMRLVKVNKGKFAVVNTHHPVVK